MNIVKEKIKKGEKVIGTFFELGGQTAVEALGIAGLDFIIIDCEHYSFRCRERHGTYQGGGIKKSYPFCKGKRYHKTFNTENAGYRRKSSDYSLYRNSGTG